MENKNNNEIYEIKMKVANDSGNSNQKTIINDDYIVQPNVIRKTNKVPDLSSKNLDSFINNIHNELLVKILSPSLEPTTCYIGKLAMEEETSRVESIKIGRGNEKCNNKIVITTAIARIAAYAVKKAYEDIKLDCKSISVKAEMEIALPVNQCDKTSVTTYIDNFMNKSHTVLVEVPEKGEIKVEIDFEFVHVLPEGIDTIYYLQNAGDKIFKKYNETHKDSPLSKEFFANKEHSIMHLAIGEGTTDFPITIGDKFKVERDYCMPFGAGEATSKTASDFNDKRRKNFTRQMISEILLNERDKFYPDVINTFEEYVETTANKIIDRIETKLEDTSAKIDCLVVYGGGSILMRNILEPKLKELAEREVMKLLYIEKEDAINIEVKGMYQFLFTNIYEALKKRYNENVK